MSRHRKKNNLWLAVGNKNKQCEHRSLSTVVLLIEFGSRKGEQCTYIVRTLRTHVHCVHCKSGTYNFTYTCYSSVNAASLQMLVKIGIII